MKKILLCLAFFNACVLGAQTSAATPAVGTTPAASTTTTASDYPRYTQMGQPPAPAGAPGSGRYFPPVPRDAKLPTLWLIGDSTVRNGTLGDGTNMGQWGWGATLPYYFDTQKINVVNRAFGGTSSRSFYDGFFWKNLQPQIKKGDFVIMQFGANDNGAASIPGVGDETRDSNGTTLHSFGWYMTQFVKETRAQGATPIIASLTPRKTWNADSTRLVGDRVKHAGWAAQVAKATDTPFVDLNELICVKYGQIGRDKVDALFSPAPAESLHTGWDGAVVNAECVISGLKALKDDPLANYFSDRGKAIAAVEVSKVPDAKPAESAATAAK